jgi:large repetitive protein
MTLSSNFRNTSDSRRPTPSQRAVARRKKRQYALEPLEGRTLLTYTFTYNAVTHVATAQGDAAVDALVISPVGGLLEHSVNGSAFDSDWNGSTVPAATTETVDVNVGTGDGSSIQLGGVGSGGGEPASLLFAAFNVDAPVNTSDTSTIDDSGGTTLAAAAYTVDTLPGTITGPGIDYDESASQDFQGGVTLLGSGADGNTYAVLSVEANEPMAVITGATGLQTVNVGSSGLLNIGSPLAIFDPAGDPTTININDTADTTHSTATLDDLSGDVNAPFEVAGLSAAPIKYGIGVTALNINGGTFGAAGVTYNINNTQATTTTTINGGPNQNFINLSNAAQTNGLDNLPGPVVVHGGTSVSDVVTLEDSSGDFNDDYTITPTTVTRVVSPFGGLTYDDNIGTLTLNAENTLGTNGNNHISVNGTADFVITNVNGQGGVDTIDVNNTGIFGILNVTTGTDDGATVNVVANNQPVNITGNGLATVNIGSTGGPGTMANIQGPISVTNPPSLTDLIFHDENDATGQTWTLDNDDGVPSGSVATTGSATTSYNPFDLASLTVNGGSGGNTFNVNATSAFYPTTLNTGDGDDATNVFATGDNTLDIHGQAGQDAVGLGADPTAGMQNLFGTINVDNALGFTDVTLDDSADATGQTALLFNDGTNGQVTGLAPATINYVNDDISSLTVFGGSGGNTFTVDGTINSLTLSPVLTSLNTGFGDDTTFVEATAAGGPLDVHGQAGQDSVLIGQFGSVSGILGVVTVDNSFGFTDLTIDASSDSVSHDFTLANTVPTTTITGFAPADIIYTTGDVSSLTINTSAFGDQVMNIDMSAGNPIPFVNTPGLIFNAGADFGTSAPGSHAINIFGELPTGPFASETHNANDPNVFPQIGQYGSIAFDDGQGAFNSLTSLHYTGLLPITDTTPAINYTFNDFADDQSFSATDGPLVGGFQTLEFANTPTSPPPTFETTDIANKNFVIFNANAPGSAAGIIGLVDVPTASDGLLSLTFNTLNAGDNTVSFINTPPGVVTSLNGGSDEDVTNVTGVGVASGTVLFLNGAGSTNSLNYDAGGLTPSITPGLLPGEVLITIPGAGIVDAINYQTINITNAGPAAPPTVTPTDPLNSIEGFQLVDAELGTFTFDLTAIGVPGLPAGLPASFFTATYAWGDGTTSAGVITQDASDPSVYHVTGTHTYADPGLFLTGLTVNFVGGSVTGVVNGVPVTITLPPVTATPGGITTAVVTDGILAVTAFPLVGTEGAVIPSQTIATFIDAGGADPIAAYTASIAITGPNGFSLIVPAASITQVGTSAQFNVIAPDITLPEEGTYQITVTVTDAGQLAPIIASGASIAVVGDADLTATNVDFNGSNIVEGKSVTTGVATFTDLGGLETLTNYTIVLNWGDGTPSSPGVITGFTSNVDGSVTYTVQGTHTYAEEGAYPFSMQVTDEAGSTVNTNGTPLTVTVADAPLTNGFGIDVSAVEGLPLQGVNVAAFEDTNPGGTVSDFSASINWGDGTITQGVVRLVGSGVFAPVQFKVYGDHTYTSAGSFTITTTIFDIGGAPNVITTSTATVADASIVEAHGASIQGVEGAPIAPPGGDVLVATFQDQNPGAVAGDFTATINWGDGTSSAATRVTATGSPNGTVFSVFGVHTYAEEGSYQVTVSISDAGGAAGIASGEADVADAALTAGAATLLTPATGVALPSTTVVGSFTDANAGAPASDFLATIDWGDGSPTITGVVVATGGGGFDVHGGHTYAKPGVYITLITVLDDGGSHVVVTGSATVADLAVTGSTKSFTTVEGQSTGLFVLASFEDPNSLATVADVNAVLAIGGWGDGTPGAAGVGLTVQLVGVNPVTGNPIFNVLGTHTYAEETPAGLPDTLSVIITTRGGVSTTLTSPPGGGVTVRDAAVVGHNGTVITGVEGTSTGPKLLGTFTDANQGATVADFTAGGGSVVVNWGDGSASETLAAANLVALGSPDGVTFTITAAHTYADEGTFAVTVIVTDDGGSTAVISGSAIIADAALTAAGAQPTVSTTEASLFPVPVFAPPVFKGAVASFTDANTAANAGDFAALIDWGDGTPMTAGSVTAGAAAGAFTVNGSHTYADAGVNGGSGKFAIQVFITDNGGSRLTVSNTATVADQPLAITGRLNPQSDSGVSRFDAVTSVRQPDFFGTSEPQSQVVLFAQALGGGPQIPIGQTVAESGGAWNIPSSVSLEDGHYVITATAVDQFGVTRGETAVITPDLLIDTRGPRITGLFFNRLNGQVDFTIQDPNLASASGVFTASLLDSSNYEFTTDRVPRNLVSRFLVTNVAVTPDSVLPNAFDVAVTFNSGAVIRGGFDVFRIRGTTAGDSSVRDRAGNQLDGDFFGSFPSGNGITGDFVAELEAVHNKVFAPQTVVGTASAANGGVGGPIRRAALFVAAVRRGGAPIFATLINARLQQSATASHQGKKAAVAHHAKPAATHSNHVKPAAVHPKGPLHRGK